MAVYFALGYAIELSLKALLIVDGVSENELRKLGHDLEQILEEVKSRDDFPLLQPSDENEILALSPYYKAKALEYLIPGYMSLPKHQNLTAVAERLLDSITPWVAVRVRDELGRGPRKEPA